MFKVVIGHSNDPDSTMAIQETLAQCHVDLAGERPQAALLFAAPDFDHSLILTKIHQTFPDIQLIGCTSDGEMSSVLDFQQDSVSLMLFCSDEVVFHAAIGRDLSKNSNQETYRIAYETAIQAKSHIQSQLQSKKISLDKTDADPNADPKNTDVKTICITVPESLTISSGEMVKGLSHGLGKAIPVIGGTAGDQWQFKGTYQFYGTEVVQDSLPILLMSGNLHFGVGASTGWTPIGKKGIVTKVDRNVLYEIDGQPALLFFQRYLGNLRPSPEYRMAVFEPNGKHWYMRTFNGHYAADIGSITFLADIPDLAEVQLVGANRDEIVSSAQISAQTALENYTGKQPIAAILFSCTGRMQVLGTRTQEEFAIVKAVLPPHLPCCGFYTYGEIAPSPGEDETLFHNETFVTLILGT